MPIFGEYETTRFLGAAGPVITRLARRRDGSGGEDYVVKSLDPADALAAFAGPVIDKLRTQFVASIRRQNASPIPGIAKPLVVDETGARPFAVTSYFPLSAKSAVIRRMEWTSLGLVQVMRSLARTLEAFQAASGNPHGNLALANVFFVQRNKRQGSILLRDIVITDPIGDPGRLTELDDLRGLGLLLQSLVERQDAWSASSAALGPNQYWEALPRGSEWLELCGGLQEAGNSDIKTYADLRRALAKFGTPEGVRLRRRAMVIAAIGVVAITGLLIWREIQFDRAAGTIGALAQSDDWSDVDLDSLMQTAASSEASMPATDMDDPFKMLRREVGPDLAEVARRHVFKRPQEPIGTFAFLTDYKVFQTGARAADAVSKYFPVEKEWEPAKSALAAARDLSPGSALSSYLDTVNKRRPTQDLIEEVRKASDTIRRFNSLPPQLKAVPPNPRDSDELAKEIDRRLSDFGKSNAVADADLIISDEDWSRMQKLLPAELIASLRASLAAPPGNTTDVAVLDKRRKIKADRANVLAKFAAIEQAWAKVAADPNYDPILLDALQNSLRQGSPTDSTAIAARLDEVVTQRGLDRTAGVAKQLATVVASYKEDAIKELKSDPSFSGGLAAFDRWKPILDKYQKTEMPSELADATTRLQAPDIQTATDPDIVSRRDTASRLKQQLAETPLIAQNREKLSTTAGQLRASLSDLELALQQAQFKQQLASAKDKDAELARLKDVKLKNEAAAREQRLVQFARMVDDPRFKNVASAIVDETKALRLRFKNDGGVPVDTAEFDNAVTGATTFFAALEDVPAVQTSDLGRDGADFDSIFAVIRDGFITQSANTFAASSGAPILIEDVRKSWEGKRVALSGQAQAAIAGKQTLASDLQSTLKPVDELQKQRDALGQLPLGDKKIDAKFFQDIDAQLATLSGWTKAATSSAVAGDVLKAPSAPAAGRGAIIALAKLAAEMKQGTAITATSVSVGVQLLNVLAAQKIEVQPHFERWMQAITTDEQWIAVGQIATNTDFAAMASKLSVNSKFNVARAVLLAKLGTAKDASEVAAEVAALRDAATAAGRADFAKTLSIASGSSGSSKNANIQVHGDTATWAPTDTPLKVEFRRLGNGRFVSTTEMPAQMLSYLQTKLGNTSLVTRYGLATSDQFRNKNAWGPATWRLEGAAGSAKLSIGGLANWLAYPNALNLSGGVPSAQGDPAVGDYPLNFVSAQAARAIARDLDLELPTMADWDDLKKEAEKRLPGLDVKAFNLKDKSWTQWEARTHVAGSGLLSASASSYAHAKDNDPTERDDGSFYFWPVTSGEEIGGFKNVFGNVAEYVVDSQDPSKTFIVGGSALSDLDKTNAVVSVKSSEESVWKLRGDVGFRLAFSGGSGTTPEQIRDLVKGVPALPPGN